jgi:uncharacterized membrane protein YphA (DoxX/SURF4 family)
MHSEFRSFTREFLRLRILITKHKYFGFVLLCLRLFVGIGLLLFAWDMLTDFLSIYTGKSETPILISDFKYALICDLCYFVGGLLLTLGYWTRVVAVIVTFFLGRQVYSLHSFAQHKYEFDQLNAAYAYLIVIFVLLVTGSGRYTIHNLWKGSAKPRMRRICS